MITTDIFDSVIYDSFITVFDCLEIYDNFPVSLPPENIDYGSQNKLRQMLYVKPLKRWSDVLRYDIQIVKHVKHRNKMQYGLRNFKNMLN